MTTSLKNTIVGLVLSAVTVAIVGVGAAAAQAEGPVWLHGANVLLAAGEERTLNSESETTFKLTIAGGPAIECPTSLDTGKFIGGEPGFDLDEVSFEGCHVQGKTLAECGAASAGMNAGIVLVELWTMLAYRAGHFNTNEEALDAVFPDPSDEEFVAFTLTGTKCAAELNNVTVTVLATGAPLLETAHFSAKCGLLGQLGLLNAAGTFVVSKSGELEQNPALNFPEPAIAEAEYTLAGGVATPFTCHLEADVSNGFKGEATESGIMLIEALNSSGVKEAIGWSLK